MGGVLRGPLTRLHAAIGLLRQQPERGEMLERIERESRRMDDLIEQLLTLAGAQSRQDDGACKVLDVGELLAAGGLQVWIDLPCGLPGV